MRKIMATALAAAMLASMSVLPTSASFANDYEVSYTTLTSSLTTDDGNTIPAGAVAITASIENNTGFNSNSFTLDTGSNCTVITDVDGNPILDTGIVLHNALVGMAVNDETVCVTVASAQSCSSDGDLFTFYVLPDASFGTSDVTISDVQQQTVQPVHGSEMMGLPGSNGVNSIIDPNTWTVYVRRGDIDNDNVVNSSDAARVLIAYDNVTPPYDTTETAIQSRFPTVVVWFQADANGDGITSNINPDYPQLSDAKTILMYAAAAGAAAPGQPVNYTGYGYQYVGQWFNAFTGQQQDPPSNLL